MSANALAKDAVDAADGDIGVALNLLETAQDRVIGGGY
jgi:hypothetical protein